MIKGFKMKLYPGMEEELTGAEVVLDPVVISDHVITSRGMGCAIAFGLAITSVLCGEGKAEELANGIVYHS